MTDKTCPVCGLSNSQAWEKVNAEVAADRVDKMRKTMSTISDFYAALHEREMRTREKDKALKAIMEYLDELEQENKRLKRHYRDHLVNCPPKPKPGHYHGESVT